MILWQADEEWVDFGCKGKEMVSNGQQFPIAFLGEFKLTISIAAWQFKIFFPLLELNECAHLKFQWETDLCCK